MCVVMKEKEVINLKMEGHGRGLRGRGKNWRWVLGRGGSKENDIILLQLKCVKNKLKRF